MPVFIISSQMHPTIQADLASLFALQARNLGTSVFSLPTRIHNQVHALLRQMQSSVDEPCHTEMPAMRTVHNAQGVPATQGSAPAVPDLQMMPTRALEHDYRAASRALHAPPPSVHIKANPPPWMSMKHAEKGLARLDAVAETTRQEAPGRMKAIALELISRPGYWNSGIADVAISLMPRTEAWPGGRALRIVDCDTGAINLFRDGQTLTYDPGNPDQLLPEPAEDEIILMREKQHYRLIDPAQDDVMIDVPADGDCFFSCISLAMGADRTELAAHNLALRQSVVSLLQAKPELMAFVTP